MKKIKIIFFPILITIFKMLFFVPMHVTGGIAGIENYKYGPIFIIPKGKDNCDGFTDGFCYEILTKRYIVEGIIVLIACLLISFILYKKNQKIKGDNNEELKG